MKKIPINDNTSNCEKRIKELLIVGAKQLTTEEILSVILGKRYKNEDALLTYNKLLLHFGGLDGLLESNVNNLNEVGIKDAKAFKLLAMAEIVRRFNSLKTCHKDVKITCPKDLVHIVTNEMSVLKQEVLKVFFLNTKNVVIGSSDVFKGSLNNSIVHPREIFKSAIDKSSASIIICHNHPSGDSTPSKEDINVTLRIKECGVILGIQLLDHIIIGNNNFVSFKDKRLI